MTRTIQASVGIRNGQQCYNLVPDQAVVMALLDLIPTSDGGTFTPGTTNSWPEPIDGQCADALHDAILEFQQVNVATVKFVDGHVDPGLGTIARLNVLADRRVVGPVFVEEQVPESGVSDYTRFEVAPDGVLIPIPSEAPAGNVILDNADIKVSPKNDRGRYTVVINNVEPDRQGGLGEIAGELTTEAAIAELEHLASQAAGGAAEGLIKFAGLGVSVLISLFTPSPIAREMFIAGPTMSDGSTILYVVIQSAE